MLVLYIIFGVLTTYSALWSTWPVTVCFGVLALMSLAVWWWKEWLTW